MIPICKDLTVVIYDDAKNIIVREIIKSKVTIQQDCKAIHQADFLIDETCDVRKKYKAEIFEGTDRVFVGLVFDHKREIGSKETKIELNSEKRLFQEAYPTTDISYTGEGSTLLNTLIAQQNALFPQYTLEASGSWSVTIEVSTKTNLYTLFDSIAEQQGVEWKVEDNRVIFGKFGRDTGIKLISTGSCDEPIRVQVSEWQRASRVIWVNKDGLTVEKSNYANGNLGTIRKDIVGDLDIETQKCLDILMGENYVYEIDVLEDIEVDICDTVNLCISSCGRQDFNGSIKVQQKEITYDGCSKTVKYIMSNGEIKRRYDFYR
jgi:hypothetical protein